MDHSGEFAYFFPSQVVTLLLLIGFLVFQLKNGFNIENRWSFLSNFLLLNKDSDPRRGNSQTDLTVHQVGMLGSNDGNVLLIQGVAIGLGSLPCSFV